MRNQIAKYVRRVASDQTDPDTVELLLVMAECIEHIPEPVAKRVSEERPLLYKGTVTRVAWICENCGKDVSVKDKYCHECGRKLFG